MIKIPIITQNFSSPDAFSDTPLMLLPQTSLSALPERDQDGFSQLILHDLHRHRNSYVRSYTAFETLKKRQDFVLRQENLRSLQNLEQRIATKQDHLIDQSIHSYEQCFVKVINGNLTPHGNLREQRKRAKTAAIPFDKFHMHQLSHIPAHPLDPPPIIPFHRYQKSHRPPIYSKYRSYPNLHRSAQSFHDAFQSGSFSNRSQPFQSFTETYLQKFTERSANKFHLTTNNDGIGELKEREDEDEDERQMRSASAQFTFVINQNKTQEHRSKTPDLQRIRTTASSRNTNTPSSTPQMSYNDAVRDGLTINKDNEDHRSKISVSHENHRPSQQSASQKNASDSKTSTKRPKTAKKKQIITGLTSDEKAESLVSKTSGSDLLKTAMFVQNYDNNPLAPTLPSKTERLPLPTTNGTRKTPSVVHRLSVKPNNDSTEIKQSFDHIDTQITTITPTFEQTEKPILDTTKEEILIPTTNPLPEIKQDTNEQSPEQQPGLESVDNRKRIKKGAFDVAESMNDMVAFELGMMGSNRGAMKRNRFTVGKEQNKTQNEDGTQAIPENQATLDLLEKIRQSASGISIGPPPVSQQSCRFELPFDLKLLESLTPLEYLSKYCRLSSRRNYQFKRMFDKHRNNQHRVPSNDLYAAILDTHSENFTRSLYDYLCQLIDIGNEQHQFTYDTFAGILALCERILYDSSVFRSGFDEHDLAKDTIERCDFDSLDRKFEGLVISDTMKRLLKTI